MIYIDGIFSNAGKIVNEKKIIRGLIIEEKIDINMIEKLFFYYTIKKIDFMQHILKENTIINIYKHRDDIFK